MSAFDLTVCHLCKHLKHVWKYSYAVSFCSKNDTTATTMTGLLLSMHPHACFQLQLTAYYLYSFPSLIINILFGSIHLFIHLTIHDSLSHCSCCVQPSLDLRYLSNVYENTKSSVHGRSVSSQGYMVVYPGLASPCVFSLGLMTAVMFTYNNDAKRVKKNKNKKTRFSCEAATAAGTGFHATY